MRFSLLAALPALALAACNGNGDTAGATNGAAPPAAGGGAESARPFQLQEVARFSEPWAMTFIPGTRQALVTERGGALKLWEEGGEAVDVAGVPAVAHGGQGGLGDVVLHPGFAGNRLVYLSWAEAGEGDTRGAAVGRARLVTEGGQPRLEGMEVIWRQEPKVTGQGHYAHRLAFAPDGHLFITSGDRQKLDPAQDMASALGKIVRLTDTGAVPSDNPFADQGGVTAQIWTSGHRNPLGIAFAPDGNLWVHEMGPAHGDELNLVQRGNNYGWPVVSEGEHYDGAQIPDHDTRPEFTPPVVSWVPAISPAGFTFYDGALFPDWQGSAFMGGMSAGVLVRIAFDGANARVADTWDLGMRVREVEQGPDGSLYVVEDGGRGGQGRLFRLTPAR